MNPTEPVLLVKRLQAAGEPSRLRLLTLCSNGALSVSDLALALRQSEPRVSRHLRILCEAGLIERFRQGQWVHYRLAGDADAASFVRGLLGQLDRRNPQLLQDAARARAAAVPDLQGSGCHAESRLGRALAGFAAAGGLNPPLGAVLVVGVTHPELLECAAAASSQCVALAPSRRAAQGARAFAERHGFPCRVLRATSPEAPNAADFAAAGAGFDAVLLDQPAAGGDALAAMLQDAGRALVSGGRLWIFERYESLESSRSRIVEHPLARLRRLLSAAGLLCERLSPIEADGEHVLAAVARLAAERSGQVSGGAGP